MNMSMEVCPECGEIPYRGADWVNMNAARARHYAKNRAQAIEILGLQLEVAELRERDLQRSRKVQRQSKVIRRMEERLRSLKLRPYEKVEQAETVEESAKRTIEALTERAETVESRLRLVEGAVQAWYSAREQWLHGPTEVGQTALRAIKEAEDRLGQLASGEAA